MARKTDIEQRAADRQIEYLADALQSAKSGGGYWLNASGRPFPVVYKRGVSISAFNAITMALFADRNNFSTSAFMSYPDIVTKDMQVKAGQKGVPFNWYEWSDYVNRHNPEDKLKREAYQKLPLEERTLYKGIHNRKIKVFFNIDQTNMAQNLVQDYAHVRKIYGSPDSPKEQKATVQRAVAQSEHILKNIHENLMPIRKGGTPVAYYNSGEDKLHVPSKKAYKSKVDYLQDTFREVARATGHQQRNAREGMVMDGGVAPSREAVRHEQLMVELISGIKMLEMGLPARLSNESFALVDDWCRDLKEDPKYVDAVEADINNAYTMIDRAMGGYHVDYKSEQIEQQTQELRDKKRPLVSSVEDAILTDIVRQYGFHVADENFKNEEVRDLFLDKFCILEDYQNMMYAKEQMKNEDAEIAEVALNEALEQAVKIEEKCREYKPYESEYHGRYDIYNSLAAIPDRENRKMVIIQEPHTGITDVLMPAGAFSGGTVVYPNGKERPYYSSPEEVASKEELKNDKVKIVSNEIKGFNKYRINHALKENGSNYVRFFNTSGVASFKPDNLYFEGKKVSEAKLNQWRLTDIKDIDLCEAIENTKHPKFDRIIFLQDDKNRWTLFMDVPGEGITCMYPDKEDLNLFFTASKQGLTDDREAIRQQLAEKYLQLSKNNPELKVDIRGPQASEQDLTRVQGVRLYKNERGEQMIYPTLLDEQNQKIQKLEARLISKNEWQRAFLFKDKSYKQQLAARIYADVLHPQRQATVDKSENERVNEKAETSQREAPHKEEQQTGGMHR